MLLIAFSFHWFICAIKKCSFCLFSFSRKWPWSFLISAHSCPRVWRCCIKSFRQKPFEHTSQMKILVSFWQIELCTLGVDAAINCDVKRSSLNVEECETVWRKKEKEELFVNELLSLERSNNETNTWWENQTWSKLREIVLAILIHTNCTKKPSNKNKHLKVFAHSNRFWLKTGYSSATTYSTLQFAHVLS